MSGCCVAESPLSEVALLASVRGGKWSGSHTQLPAGSDPTSAMMFARERVLHSNVRESGARQLERGSYLPESYLFAGKLSGEEPSNDRQKEQTCARKKQETESWRMRLGRLRCYLIDQKVVSTVCAVFK